MAKNYVFKPGDILYVNFGKRKNTHLQSGKRPAIVLSSVGYNIISRNMIIVAPISSSNKYYNSPLVQKLPPEMNDVHGAVLLQHLQAIDTSMIVGNQNFPVIARTTKKFVKACQQIIKKKYFN